MHTPALMCLQETQLLQMTFLGLKDVEARFGSTSPQLAASKQAVKQVLQWAVAQLDSHFQGDVTFQVGRHRLLLSSPLNSGVR